MGVPQSNAVPPTPGKPASREAALRILSREELAEAFVVCLRRGRMRGWSLTSQLLTDQELILVLAEFRRRLYANCEEQSYYGGILQLPAT